MDFKQLSTFVTVAKCRNFTRAAEKLFISQPTVSAHISALESELKCTLFVRTTKAIEITQEGMELFECAERILRLRDDLMERLSGKANRVIHIGASTTPSAYILPEILPKYRRLHPDVHFTVHQNDSRGVIKDISNGNIDLGIVGAMNNDKNLVFHAIRRDRLVLITPADKHFLAMKRVSDPIGEILSSSPLIMRERGSGTRECAEAFLESSGIAEKDLNIIAAFNDQESINKMVAGGLGVAIVSEMAVGDPQANGKLLTFPLPDSATRNIYLAYKNEPNPSPDTSSFISFVLSSMGSLLK